MTDPNNPYTTPASNGTGTSSDAGTQPVEVSETTETFAYTTPQMPDLPPNPNAAPADQTAAPQTAYTQTQYTQQYAQPTEADAQQQYNAQQQYAAQYSQPTAGSYGAYAPAAEQGYIPRNKILAGLLALFFGMLGIHNFYLGFTGKAIAQLLLTCLGWIVFGLGPLAALIWSIVEGVQILTSNYGTPAHRDARGVELVD